MSETRPKDARKGDRMNIPGIKSVGPAPPVPPTRDNRPLHERIISYLERSEWVHVPRASGRGGEAYGRLAPPCVAITVCIRPHLADYRSVNDGCVRLIAEVDKVSVLEVVGRKPTPNETTLLRCMMAGRAGSTL